MDDTPDKLRRNVVVLSAAIVAITVFHLSFRPTGTLLGFAEVGNVTPLKVWLALTAVLGYVFLRYWFHDDTAAERAALADHYRGLRYAALQRQLRGELDGYLTMRQPPRSLQDFDGFGDNPIVAQRIDAVGPALRTEIVPAIEHVPPSPWEGRVAYTFVMAGTGGAQYAHHGGRAYHYRVAAPRAHWIAASCALQTTTWSKGAVDLLVPIVLAGVAGVMCGVQLVRAVLA